MIESLFHRCVLGVWRTEFTCYRSSESWEMIGVHVVNLTAAGGGEAEMITSGTELLVSKS